MGIEEGRTNTCYMHVTLVPHLASVGEIKTKPTQHSVKELRGIGIQPDIVMCRSEQPRARRTRSAKIALFTNVDVRSVISAYDVRLHLQDPDDAAQAGPGRDRLPEARPRRLPGRPLDVGAASWTRSRTRSTRSTSPWSASTWTCRIPTSRLSEALIHAGIHTRTRVKIHYVDSEQIEAKGTEAARRTWTRSSCPAASASAASRARSRRSATRARTRCPTSASAWGCRSR